MNFSLFARPALAIAVGSICVHAIATPVTAFHFASSPTSYVGGGMTKTLLPADSSFLVNTYGHMDYLYVQVSGRDFWMVSLGAPVGERFSLGRYENAMRFPTATSPSLDFWGDGRAPNESIGYFDLLDLSYNADGTVRTLAVDFVQYDNNRLDAWNRGSLRYESEIPLSAVPEPTSPAMLLAGIVLGSVAVRRRRSAKAERSWYSRREASNRPQGVI